MKAYFEGSQFVISAWIICFRFCSFRLSQGDNISQRGENGDLEDSVGAGATKDWMQYSS